MTNTALTQNEFAALMSPYGVGGERVAVAVSGGPDSMALAFCLLRQAGPQNTIALIVEHGLRDESADEAAGVAANLCAMGLETEILPWVHDKVDSRIHVRARDARYGLLLDACKWRGIDKLFLAHHADDQAETILMRFAKGSGIDGLAGMDAVTDVEGVRLIRPLLDVPKSSLVSLCVEHKVPFVTDPSNVSEKYARGRLRRVMPLLAPEGFTPERLIDLGHRAQEAKQALDFYTHAFLREAAEVLPGGVVRLDLTALRGVPRAVGLRVVTLIFTDLHEADYAPERKHVVSFLDWLLDTDHRDARTLHGCLVQKGDICDKATFLREGEALTDCQPIAGWQTILWDERWQVTVCDVPSGCEVRALGTQTHEVTDSFAPRLRAMVPQGRVRSCLPALWCAGSLWAIPSFCKEDQGVARAMRQPFSWEEIVPARLQKD